MTASRALRGAPRVSEATTQKVCEAARELGYNPNPLVQAVMSGVRSRGMHQAVNIAWIKVIRSQRLNRKLKEVEAGARKRAVELGFGLDTISLTDERMNARAVSRIFHARNIYGAIIEPLPASREVNWLPWDDYAYATIGRSLTAPHLHYTMGHHYHIMDHVLSVLKEKGYQRIGFLHSKSMDLRAEHGAAMMFYHQIVMQEGGPNSAHQWHDNWEVADYKRWLKDYRPDAVIADFPWVLDLLQEAGAEVPAKLGFVTLSYNEQMPHCSGMRQPAELMGAGAVDLVVAQLHRNERGIPESPKTVLVEGTWMDGTTLWTG